MRAGPMRWEMVGVAKTRFARKGARVRRQSPQSRKPSRQPAAADKAFEGRGMRRARPEEYRKFVFARVTLFPE